MFGLGFLKRVFGGNDSGNGKVNNAITRNAKPLARLGRMIEEACNIRDSGNGCGNGRKLCQRREDRLERESRFPTDFAKRMRETIGAAQEKANAEPLSPPSPPPQAPPSPLFPPSLTLAELMHECRVARACEHGWDEDEGFDDECLLTFADQLAAFHAEISETWGEYQKHGLEPDKFIYHGRTHDYEADDRTLRFDGITFPDPKPEGIAVELADLLIRVADTCQRYNIPIERAIREKMEYNKTRPHRHGGKKA